MVAIYTVHITRHDGLRFHFGSLPANFRGLASSIAVWEA